MIIFISGGCKNGKSSYAQRISQKMRKAGATLYYLATMIPVDDEDDARIARHRKEREGCDFETIEVRRNIVDAIDKCYKQGTFLLDSLTALLANEMFPTADRIEFDAYKKVADDLTDILSKINDIVIVSDHIYSDAVLYDEITEAYRQGLAHIDKHIARLSDVVLESCGGNCIVHKGEKLITEMTNAID
jgi:adenosylcobinamide kinase/adenosylcobinamide-phosphate guanylyltransferase